VPVRAQTLRPEEPHVGAGSCLEQASGANFFFRENLHPAQQLQRFQNRAHIFNLIHAGAKEELAELDQRLQGEIAAAIQIIAARPSAAISRDL